MRGKSIVLNSIQLNYRIKSLGHSKLDPSLDQQALRNSYEWRHVSALMDALEGYYSITVQDQVVGQGGYCSLKISLEARTNANLRLLSKRS